MTNPDLLTRAEAISRDINQLPEAREVIRELVGVLEHPVDLLLFCPQCGEQHVDEAKPDVCETCGHGEMDCTCVVYTAWLNPPHKSHRCAFCNHVWRPADVPTNGVQTIQTKGSNDGNARPCYYCTAQDFKDAVASIAERLRQFEQESNEPVEADS